MEEPPQPSLGNLHDLISEVISHQFRDDDQTYAEYNDTVLAAISSTLAELLTTVRRMEHRLEWVVGRLSEPEPTVWADVEGLFTDQAEYEQSVLRRSWDAVSQKWVYEPGPTSE